MGNLEDIPKGILKFFSVWAGWFGGHYTLTQESISDSLSRRKISRVKRSPHCYPSLILRVPANRHPLQRYRKKMFAFEAVCFLSGEQWRNWQKILEETRDRHRRNEKITSTILNRLSWSNLLTIYENTDTCLRFLILAFWWIRTMSCIIPLLNKQILYQSTLKIPVFRLT